jgi:hypothetical protein
MTNSKEARDALKLAIAHIDHMAAWITKQNAGYSFEGLGEDMPCIRTALTAQQAARREDDAIKHLGNVLYMLAELHEDDQCRAFSEAMSYYNAARPNQQVVPIEGYSTRLVQTGPFDAALSPDEIQSSDGGECKTPGEPVADKRSSADASASSGDSVVAGIRSGPSDSIPRRDSPDAGYIARDFKEAYIRMKERALEAEACLAAATTVPADREAIAKQFAAKFPAVLSEYSQFKIVDWFLALSTVPADERGGVG